MPRVLYAFDFDGVLVHSAAEVGKSGFKAAHILFPNAEWLESLEQNPTNKEAIIHRFCDVRACLDTGWEAALILKLLADGDLSNDDIIHNFQTKLKDKVLQECDVTEIECNDAFRKVRDDWIRRDEEDWIRAHEFYDGACAAVRDLVEGRRDDVYLITTKGTEYASQLLKQQKIDIHPFHIYGLGTGPKKQVLATIIEHREADLIVMVEDNVATLSKITADTKISDHVLPVVASWGYNTKEQRETATKAGYVVLDPNDPSSLSQVLDDVKAKELFDKYFSERST